MTRAFSLSVASVLAIVAFGPHIASAQGRDYYERNNEFNLCGPGNMDPRCYVAQDRGYYERNNEFNTCGPGSVDPRCYSASGGGRYDPRDFDDEDDDE